MSSEAPERVTLYPFEQDDWQTGGIVGGVEYRVGHRRREAGAVNYAFHYRRTWYRLARMNVRAAGRYLKAGRPDLALDSFLTAIDCRARGRRGEPS